MKYIEVEERPWGKFYVIHNELLYKLKRIEINPSGRLSYQFHKKRSEAWTVIKGIGLITLEGIKKIEGRWFPSKFVYKDELKRNSKGTEWIIENIQFNKKIPDYRFSKALLRK